MAEYIISSQAETDISEIINYIAVESPDAAMLLYERLITLFNMLAANPKIGRLRPEIKEDLRSFPTGSYIVFYRRWAGEIAIVRVLHGARDLEELVS